jgi:hypothetical protein
MDESRSPVNRKICYNTLGQLRLSNTALFTPTSFALDPHLCTPIHIWGFGVPPYPTQKGTFHGGVPVHPCHYGILRLRLVPPHTDPRHMVPSG